MILGEVNIQSNGVGRAARTHGLQVVRGIAVPAGGNGLDTL